MAGESKAQEAVGAGFGSSGSDRYWQLSGKGGPRRCTVAPSLTPNPAGDAETVFDERLACEWRKASPVLGHTMEMILGMHQ
ncbi:hypothetical protein GCM10011371_16680 [Novosphingobium marinum]|nr:hypothetical protein GCM10011371_16680 [Novosphingobium marinum]